MYSIISKSSKIIIAAHSGNFHADDVFAVATLWLTFGDAHNAHNNDTQKFQVVRTRDELLISQADFVVDVGGIHDPSKNRFDHHQSGGAGVRPNGIPYAAFGLVWQKFGEQVSGSKEVAAIIDQRLVTPADAVDNGVSISREIISDVRPYDISSVIGSMNPNWNETKLDNDAIFMKAVMFAKSILVREIKSAQADIEGEQFVIDTYNQTQDKTLIVFDGEYPWGKILSRFPEPLFVVYPKEGNWRISAVRNNLGSFENRKNLPAAWAGKRGEELSVLTGVSGAVFCHNKLFKAGAVTKEGAIMLARLALAA